VLLALVRTVSEQGKVSSMGTLVHGEGAHPWFGHNQVPWSIGDKENCGSGPSRRDGNRRSPRV
jgi:hypothetical protein